ncbi:diiron oxygenase [Pseudomonas taetrolens]|uniref:diiron oxygenase n=1 Tax=Pseudomonas taetrolens TaxID=47884 RepID=UPI0030DC26A0
MNNPASQPAGLGLSEQHCTLGDWDSTACVRIDRRDYLLPAELEHELENRHWFVPAFMPYLAHPKIVQADRSMTLRLEANQLVYFLDYTTLLEHKIVNRAVETLIHNELGIPIPGHMKNAALQLYTDEGYHALFSNQVAEQVAQLYDIQNRSALPLRVTRLQGLIEKTPAEHQALTWFLVGFVSETVIAKELLGAARNTVVSTVFRMLKSHLEDEARHSRYFSDVFAYVWMQLEQEQRSRAARSLVAIIGIFFETDSQWLRESFDAVDLDETTIEGIVAALAHPDAHRKRVRSGASATLLAMSRGGFFDDDENLLLMREAGYIND